MGSPGRHVLTGVTSYPKPSNRRQMSQCYTLAQVWPARCLGGACSCRTPEVPPAMTPPARRALFSLILFFAVCAVAGTFLQSRVGAQSSQDESQIRDSLKSFTAVYALVEQNYAEPISGDRVVFVFFVGVFL